MNADQSTQEDRDRRLEWFRRAHFGAYLYWGLHSQLGKGEWVMNRERIPIEEYEKLIQTSTLRPDAARCWVKAVKSAGMRYMVVTAKHHDGYCLFDSKVSDYNSVARGPGRDVIAEYVEAARAEGIGVGIYYSQMDWHHPDGMKCKKYEDARKRFVDYTHALVRELCTNYGKLDIWWWDVSWPLDADEWEADKLNAMVHQLQPDIIINDRTAMNVPEDFDISEGAIKKPEDENRMWEACMNMNGEPKAAAARCINNLCQVAAAGGNLLVPLHHTPDGSVPQQALDTYPLIGRWLDAYGYTVFEATDPMPNCWQTPGKFTRKGQTVYYHCHPWVAPELPIGGLRNKVLSARFYGGDEVKWTQKGDRLVFSGLPEEAPDPIDTVIEMEVEGEPRHELGPGYQLIEDV